MPSVIPQGQVLTLGDNVTLTLRSKVKLNLTICGVTRCEAVRGCDRVKWVLQTCKAASHTLVAHNTYTNCTQ